MRDAIVHCELILAGMWGGVAGILPNMVEMFNVLENNQHEKWIDQAFTRQILWPLIKDQCLAHDHYYQFYNAIDFPPHGRRHVKSHVGAIESWDLQRL